MANKRNISDDGPAAYVTGVKCICGVADGNTKYTQMRMKWWAAALFIPVLGAQTVEQAVARLAEEADLFYKTAHRIAGVETFRQTLPAGTRVSRGRYGVETSLPEQVREIVSEYGFIAVDERGGSLKEARVVVTVDGKRWKRGNESLESLAPTLSTLDDKKKRRLLEGYEVFGVEGFVSDLGQLLLLFSRGLAANYTFTLEGEEDGVIQYSYEQAKGNGDAVTVYAGKSVLKQAPKGNVWIRKSDLMPVKIGLMTSRREGNVPVVDLSYVEYEKSEFGPLLPKRVVHQSFIGKTLMALDEYTYSGFHELAFSPVRQ